tara:strand:+ start:7217 stop:8488 length:1272 start_codon:yes stop_codon:yes gene_type:complete
MPFKPSEMFIRALDDAEVRPDSTNAQMVNDPNANPASRLGALIDLSMAERAKSRARAQVPQGSNTVADKVISSFMQSQMPAPAAPMQMGQGLAGMMPQPQVPGFQDGGVFDEEIMAQIMGIDGGLSSIASDIGLTQDQIQSIQDSRDARRVNVFTGEEYQPESDARIERIKLQRALGIPQSFKDRSTIITNPRETASRVREELPEMLDEAGSTLLGLPDDFVEAARNSVSSGPQEFTRLPGEVNLDVDQDDADLFNIEGDELEAPGMSNLQKAMVLLSAAQGLSAPISPGGSTVGNLTQALSTGVRGVAADKLARERTEAQRAYRQSTLEGRRASQLSRAREKSISLAIQEAADLFPDSNFIDDEKRLQRSDFIRRRSAELLEQILGSSGINPDVLNAITEGTRRVSPDPTVSPSGFIGPVDG